MIPIAILMTLLLLFALNYYLCRDLRYPPSIACVLWFFILALYYASPIPINQIEAYTAFIFIVFVVAFSAGGCFALLFDQLKPMSVRRDDSFSSLQWVKRACLVVALIALPVMLLKAKQMADRSWIDNPVSALRYELTNSSGYGFLGNAALVSYFGSFLYAMGDQYRKGRLERFLAIAISCSYMVLSTGRAAFLFFFCVLLSIAWLKGTLTMKRVVASVLIFFVIFGAIGVTLGKGGNTKNDFLENLPLITDSALTYMVGPVPAFDFLVRRQAAPTLGVSSVSGILDLIYRATGDPEISPIFPEIEVPFLVNIFTGIAPPYNDFGVLGVFVTFFLIGAGTSLFYLKATAGDGMYVLFYAMALFPLVLITFSDQYFFPIVYLARYFIAAFICFRLPRFISFLKDLRVNSEGTKFGYHARYRNS